jgi:transposase-like protein
MASREPNTLLEAIRYFSDPDVALHFVAGMKWPHGVVCPRCHGSEKNGQVYFLANRRLWKCRSCKKQFSAKVGTIFEDSPIKLEKWLPAVWLLANCKNGISSYELGRALGVTQKTAWFMLSRIRLMLQSKWGGKMGGGVEVDETYIGGRARNMHADKRARVIPSSKTAGKVAVFGLLERYGNRQSRVRTMVVPNAKRRSLRPMIDEHVEPGATIYSDALPSYKGLESDYIHNVIDHAEFYAKGEVHTNGLENF